MLNSICIYAHLHISYHNFLISAQNRNFACHFDFKIALAQFLSLVRYIKILC
jgi:hypothetical protein